MTYIVKKPNLPITTHSLTSIKITQPTKIDSIIIKLQTRKKEIIEILSKNKLFNNLQTSLKQTKDQLYYNSNIYNNNNINKQQQNIQNKLERKKKYSNKIEKQIKQYQQIQQEINNINCQLMQCVIQLQQNQIKLKKIAQNIGIQYRNNFGIKQQHCQNCKKWIYSKILQLQNQLQGSQLNMRTIICKFYKEQNNIKEFNKNLIFPTSWLIQYIVKFKLVNKLYGAILHNKQYRVKNRIQQLDQQQQNIQLNQSDIQYIEKSRNLMDAKKYHDIWLQILKLMKTLQKLQPISTNLQEFEAAPTSDINIPQFQKSILAQINQSKKIKSMIKSLNLKIINYRTKIQELNQQKKIKQQLITNLKQKISLLNQQTIKQINMNKQNKKIQENQNKQKCQQFMKELKEIDEAIKYFIIKKNTKIENLHKQINNSMHIKSIDECSTLFVSPQKSTINHQRFLSPNLCGTKRKTIKYSLKYLLSPQKEFLTQDKKKVWK